MSIIYQHLAAHAAPLPERGWAWSSSARRLPRPRTFEKRLSIRTPSVKVEVDKLSGGNQQKVMLSKWLNAQPKLLILDEPTRGIDVGAKAEVHHMINDLAAEGLGIILISSDLPEVLAMSDRILVMREGRQMGIFDRQEATQEKIMTAAMGQSALGTRARPPWRPSHEYTETPLSARTDPGVGHPAAHRPRAALLWHADRQLFQPPLLQPHFHQRGHHRRRGRGPDAGLSDPQHRPIRRLHRRLYRLLCGPATGRQQRHGARCWRC